MDIQEVAITTTLPRGRLFNGVEPGWMLGLSARMTRADPPRDPTPAPLDESAAHRQALIQFFRRKLRDPQEIEDLVQEVYLRLAARGSGERIENVAGYLFQTAAAVLADYFRRRSVRHAGDHVEFDADRHAESDFDAERVLASKQALGNAVAALRELPERTRWIFVWRRLEGHQYKDIASRLGISVSAVEKHMVRAMHHLIISRERQ
jgi:RNA polymerase sigma-70 factor (ECF subfamily)